MQKTKLPPAGKSRLTLKKLSFKPKIYINEGGGGLGLSQNLASSYNNQLQINEQTNDRVTSKTAPARLEGFDDDSDQENENSVLIKVSFLF